MCRLWGTGLIYLSGQEGCWGVGVSLAGQTRRFFVCALKRQGSWSGRAWWVPELGVGAELSLPQEDGELDQR